MQCPKCNHTISDKSESCLYCGAPMAGNATARQSVVFADKNSLFVQTQETRELKIEDLPENLRGSVEEAIRQGKKEVVVKENTAISHSPENTSPKTDSLPSEKLLPVLTKMKDLLNNGQMQAADYERMTLSIITEHLSNLDDQAKLACIDPGNKDIALHQYVNEAMLKKLKSFVIKAIADKEKKHAYKCC